MTDLYRTGTALTVLVAVVLLSTVSPATAADAVPDCRINEGPCASAAGNLAIGLEVLPRPVKAMRELSFNVTVRDRGAAVTSAAVSVDLSMPGMVMGKNVVILRHQGNGRYEGKGVIVRCPTGQRVWKADVAVKQGARTMHAPFLIEVH